SVRSSRSLAAQSIVSPKHPVEFKHGPGKRLGTVECLRRFDRFLRCMAAAIAAGRKNHAYGAAMGDMNAVVSGAARHIASRQTKSVRGAGDRFTHHIRARRRTGMAHLLARYIEPEFLHPR